MGGSPCGIVASLSRRGGSPKEFYPRARREFFAFSSRRLMVFFTSTKGARDLELALTFAFLLRIVLQFRSGMGLSRPFQGERPDASAHETAARDLRLPQRIHPAARLRAEPRGDRPSLWAFVARHGAQTPDEPTGERLYQTSLEPQSFGGDGAGADGRPRRRAAPSRLCRRGPAHRSRRLERNDFGS